MKSSLRPLLLVSFKAVMNIGQVIKAQSRGGSFEKGYENDDGKENSIGTEQVVQSPEEKKKKTENA